MRKLILILITFLSFTGHAQDYGGRIGLNFQFGTHQKRIGMMYQLYWFNNSLQLSHGAHFHFNFKNLGPPGAYFESKLLLGLQLHWGEQSFEKYHFNEYSNMAPHDYHLGYLFYYIFDDADMTQTTGALVAGLKEWTIATENDAFGTNPYVDRFRTGAFIVSYQKDSLLMSVQSTLWTGLSYDAPRVKDSDYPAKKGYRDPTNVKYGQYSHGVLAGRVDYISFYKQVLRFEAGIDSERIRNLFQNKIIHDVMPDKWVGYANPHYPMLDENGKPYLYRSEQRIRKDRLFIQAAANQTVFY